MNLQIPNFHFSEKSAFESGLLFLIDISLFSNRTFSLFSAEPLSRMCVSTIGSFTLSGEQLTNHITLVESFFLVFSDFGSLCRF